MKIVSTSYINTPEYDHPEKWLDRISFYTGILEELAKYHEVESVEQVNYSGQLVRNKVTYHFLNFGDKKNFFPFKLHKHIKKLSPDVMLVNGIIFPLQIIQLRVALGNDVKIIIIHRSEKPFRGIKKYLQQLADRSADAYLFSSAGFGKHWVGNGIIKDKNKIYEVMHGSSSFQPLEKDVTRPLLAVDGSPIFLWVGRLNSNKDPLTVIKAFKQYLKFHPSARLYMIYQSEELINETKKTVDDTVGIILIGKIEHKNLEYWYSSADFIISGSHYEGGGIAISEAMSCGCIPIITDIISFRQMTGRGKCGLLYEPGNAEDLLSALLKTNEMDVALEREKVIKQFKEELSFQAIAKKLTTIIDSFK